MYILALTPEKYVVVVVVVVVMSVMSNSATTRTVARPPGSSVRGISQARILECAAISSSRGSSPPRGLTHVLFASCIDRWIL